MLLNTILANIVIDTFYIYVVFGYSGY